MHWPHELVTADNSVRGLVAIRVLKRPLLMVKLAAAAV
jgi:hypothetical protein